MYLIEIKRVQRVLRTTTSDALWKTEELTKYSPPVALYYLLIAFI